MAYDSQTLIRDLSDAPDFDQCVDIFARHLRAMGFPRMTYSYMPLVRRADGQWLAPPLVVRNFPKCWDSHWGRYSVHDPYFQASFNGTTSIDWTVVQKSKLTAIQRECVRYLADLGLSKGLTVPIHLPYGGFAFISAIADDHQPGWNEVVAEYRYEVLILAHQFQRVVRSKHGFSLTRVTSPALLTRREAECLSWVARGRKHNEIADLIGRSTDTVRLHLKSACNKLGASNRAQAVAKAVHLGLLDIHPLVTRRAPYSN